MKKKLLAGILAAVTALSLAACGGNSKKTESAASSAGTAASSAQSGSGDVDYIKKKGELLVGITDFAPMDYKDKDGSWIGFDADLAKKVSDDLGVKVKFVEIDWDNKILELNNKSVDVLWNGMTMTDEVTKATNCTQAYLKNAQVVVLPKDQADKYKDKDSLKNLHFAVETGSAGEEAAKAEKLDYSPVKSQANALMEVKSGTSDACIIDLLMAGAMIGEGTDFANMTHTVELTEEEYGIGCRKGSDLTDYINEELKKFQDDGSLKTLAEKYGVQESLIELK